MPSTFATWLREQPSLTGSPLSFDLNALPADPVELFRERIVQAAELGVSEPHAATLSTADASGLPDSRTLILKDVDTAGWAVAGLRSSAKGTQLHANPAAALNFWWQPIMRAVRLRGTVSEASPEESEADLAARSLAARSGIESGQWVLWRIDPERIEFWQGAQDRRHTRVIYERRAGAWHHAQIRGERQNFGQLLV